MILFLDFDDTLLNTKRFNEELSRYVSRTCDFAEDAFLKTRKMMKEAYPHISGYYNFDKHTELLSESSATDSNVIKQATFDFIVQNTSEHIFSDVPKFLQTHNKKHTCILLTMTFDESEYQTRKITHSGIADYFDDIIYTKGEQKSLIIKRYLRANKKSERAVFLDDRRDWLTDAVIENQGLHSTHMLREDRRHFEDSGEHTQVKDMNEFAQLLASF
ncbi:MAG: HAD hydrolase-like protein [bacterium]|nr:HAD hydrolase-like protein [bacterium]